MEKIKISAVSFINTLPFVYGIQHSSLLNSRIELSLDRPAVCADKLINNTVDISLVPVGAVDSGHNFTIISDYCIGANGSVKSVLLLSMVPLNEIKAVYLDYHSRTSINLVRILAKKWWNIQPQWIPAKIGYEKLICGTTAGVIIGDRTFNLEQSYPFQYDLAYEWQLFTGLPFVFAVWMANKSISPPFIEDFNSAIEYGMANIPKVVEHYRTLNPDSTLDIHAYFTENVSYNFDEAKHKALQLFWKYKEELDDLV